MSARILFLLAACCLTTALASYEDIYEDDGDKGPLSNNCLRCICEVIGCPHESTCNGLMCGPFRITYPYWSLAFYRGEDEKDEYRRCTLNAWCATRTVQAHMKRFLPQCVCNTENDSRSVCETALAIHNYGYLKCNKTIPAEDKRRLGDCLDRRAWNWLSSGSINPRSSNTPTGFFV